MKIRVWSWVKHLACGRHLMTAVAIIFITHHQSSPLSQIPFSFTVVFLLYLQKDVVTPHSIGQIIMPMQRCSSQLPGNPYLHRRKDVPFLNHHQNHTCPISFTDVFLPASHSKEEMLMTNAYTADLWELQDLRQRSLTLTGSHRAPLGTLGLFWLHQKQQSAHEL